MITDKVIQIGMNVFLRLRCSDAKYRTTHWCLGQPV